MLRLNKKDLAAMAKKMKVASHSYPAKELKMKAVVEVPLRMTKTRARGLSLREDEKLLLSPPSTLPLMAGLLHNTSLYLVLPLLETLGCRRVGERTFKREDCGIHPWMPLLSRRRPYFLPRPG